LKRAIDLLLLVLTRPIVPVVRSFADRLEDFVDSGHQVAVEGEARGMADPTTNLQADPRDDWTYVMLDRASGQVKIGHSRSPHARCEALQRERPEIALVAAVPLNVEGEMHRALDGLRVTGEYFAIDPEVAIVELEKMANQSAKRFAA
jgi:hypothetical protein